MWRIRVNSNKCKLLKNEHCDDMGGAFIGDTSIKEVDFLKYLGYWIGKKGRKKNDDHIKAQAAQLRFTVRVLRRKLGEYLATEYIEAHATPSILHGSFF
jgi:hypothetical protein